MEAIYNKSALQFGEVQMFGYVHSKSRKQKMTYGYMHAVADRLPEVSGHDKWIGGVVVALFPGLRTWW